MQISATEVHRLVFLQVDCVFFALLRVMELSRAVMQIIVWENCDVVDSLHGRSQVAQFSLQANMIGICSTPHAPWCSHRCRTHMRACRSRFVLSPQAIVVPPRMDAYSQAGKGVFDVFDDTSPLVEGISIDEAFFEVRGLARIVGTPLHIGIVGRRPGYRAEVAELRHRDGRGHRSP